MVQFLKVPVNSIILKINNSWMESFNFQNYFNCHRLELLRTAPLPIHKVIIISIFLSFSLLLTPYILLIHDVHTAGLVQGYLKQVFNKIRHLLSQ